MKGNWLDPKIYKPKQHTQVLTKSIFDGVTYYHVAYYDAINDVWYNANDDNDDVMYKEYIVGWMHIPE